MSRLDRYVGRIVLGAFLAASAFFVFLAVLVDLLNNVSRYADRAREAGLGGGELALRLATHYVKAIPVTVTTVTPFATAIACMFAVARLQQANEVVPMLFVGRSIQRIAQPMLLLAVGAAAAMAGSWQWIVPRVGPDMVRHEAFLQRSSTVHENLVHEVRAKGQHFFAAAFDPGTRTLHGVSYVVRGGAAAAAEVQAAAAAWDDARRDWRLIDGWSIGTQENTRQEWLGRPDLTPEVLVQTSRDTVDPEFLSYSDLHAMTATRPNRADVRLAFHRHITWPLANLLLALLVLPLAVHFERGSRIARVLAAIGLCGAYLLLDLTCQSLGQRRFFHPVAMAWTPPIVFGALGAVLFGGTRT